MDASLAAQASAMLGEVNFLYGVASGVLLKFSFDWSGNRDKFERNEVLLALATGFGALVLALVLVALMWEIASAAIGGRGSMEFTLVIFVLTWVVMIVLAAVSVWAVVRAASDLWYFRQDLRG